MIAVGAGNLFLPLVETPASCHQSVWYLLEIWYSSSSKLRKITSTLRLLKGVILYCGGKVSAFNSWNLASQQDLLPQNILLSLMSTRYNVCHQHNLRIIPESKSYFVQQATLLREKMANQYTLSYLNNEFCFFVSVIECWYLPSTI